MFVLAADGVGDGLGEVPRGARFLRQPGSAAWRGAGFNSSDVPVPLFM